MWCREWWRICRWMPVIVSWIGLMPCWLTISRADLPGMYREREPDVRRLLCYIPEWKKKRWIKGSIPKKIRFLSREWKEDRSYCHPERTVRNIIMISAMGIYASDYWSCWWRYWIFLFSSAVIFWIDKRNTISAGLSGVAVDRYWGCCLPKRWSCLWLSGLSWLVCSNYYTIGWILVWRGRWSFLSRLCCTAICYNIWGAVSSCFWEFAGGFPIGWIVRAYRPV